MARVIAYGSSTTYGLWGGDRGGFVERLKNSYIAAVEVQPQKRLVTFDNRGQPGELITHTIMKLESDISTEFLQNRGRKIGLFLLGACDASIPKGESRPATSKVRFQADLGNLRQSCERMGVIPAFLGLPPLDNLTTNPFVKTGEIFDDDLRREYESIVRDHAKENGDPFMEIYDRLGGKNIRRAGFVSFDDLHINGGGHQEIHDEALPVVNNMLSEPDSTHALPFIAIENDLIRLRTG